MKVHELLTDESKWTQATFARDRNGESVDTHSSDAVCWCLAGALHKCYEDGHQFYSIISRIQQAEKLVSVTYWNDEPYRMFSEVRELVTRLDI